MKYREHVLAALALLGLFTACSAAPTTPSRRLEPSAVPVVAGNYTWTIRPAATCVLGSNPDNGVVSYATAVPLTQNESAISLSLTTMFSGISLTGTVGSGGAVTFPLTARGANPMQETTLSGTGVATATESGLSGTFDGDFRYTPKSLPPSSSTCHAANHSIELIRR